MTTPEQIEIERLKASLAAEARKGLQAEKYRKALESIAAMKHADRSCSLEVQGYVHDDCLVIAATDSIADIAIAALAEPKTARQVWLEQIKNNE